MSWPSNVDIPAFVMLTKVQQMNMIGSARSATYVDA